MIVNDLNNKFCSKAIASFIPPGSSSVLSNKLNTVRKVRSALKKSTSLRQKSLQRRLDFACSNNNDDQENNNPENKPERQRKVHFAPMAKVVVVRKISKEDGKHIWYNWFDYRSFERERRKAVAYFQDAIENKRIVDPKKHTISGLEKYLNMRSISSSSSSSTGSRQHGKEPYLSDSEIAPLMSEIDTQEKPIQDRLDEPTYQHTTKHFVSPEPHYYYNYGYNYWYGPNYDYRNYQCYSVPKYHYNPDQFYQHYDYVNTPYIPVYECEKEKPVCITPVS
jgi:hypothetical protein